MTEWVIKANDDGVLPRIKDLPCGTVFKCAEAGSTDKLFVVCSNGWLELGTETSHQFYFWRSEAVVKDWNLSRAIVVGKIVVK